MSEANEAPGPQGGAPVTEDDRPTGQQATIPSTADEGRHQPSPGQGSNGQAANGQRTARDVGPQPSASGWTPPPLGGRQTPAPPGETERPAAGRDAAPARAADPSPAPAAGPARAEAPPARAAGPATAAAAAASAPAASKRPAGGATIPFWQRLTEALGIDGKPRAAASAPTAAAPAVATPAVAAAAPAAPAESGTAAKAAPPSAAKPAASGAPAAAGGAPQARAGTAAPTHPGPQQYRVGEDQQNPASAATAVQPATDAAPGPQTGAALAAGPKPARASTHARRTRKARLRLSRLDPWSVMKTSFLFSIAAGIMLVVAVYAIWAVLSTSGLFTSVNDIVASVVSTPGDTTPFRVEDYFNTQRIMGVAALLASVDVLLITALATLGSFLYNLAATMLGGLEITLAED